MRCAGNKQAPAGGSCMAADAVILLHCRLHMSGLTPFACPRTVGSTPVTGEDHSPCQRSLPAMSVSIMCTVPPGAAVPGALTQCQVLVAFPATRPSPPASSQMPMQ